MVLTESDLDLVLDTKDKSNIGLLHVLRTFLKVYFHDLRSSYTKIEKDTYWSQRVINHIQHLTVDKKQELIGRNRENTDVFDSFDLTAIFSLTENNWYGKEDDRSIQKLYQLEDFGVEINEAFRRCRCEGRNNLNHNSPISEGDIVSIFNVIRKICSVLPIGNFKNLTNSKEREMLVKNLREQVYALLLLMEAIEIKTSTSSQDKTKLDIRSIMTRFEKWEKSVQYSCYTPAIADLDSAILYQLGSIYADMYEDGQLQRDYKTPAIKYFRAAWKKGHVPAGCSIGKFYDAGYGAKEPDYSEAFKWFSTCADKGYPAALTAVGVYYGLGKGVGCKDEKEARSYLDKAIKCGDTEAQNMIRNLVTPERFMELLADKNKDELIAVIKSKDDEILTLKQKIERLEKENKRLKSEKCEISHIQ